MKLRLKPRLARTFCTYSGQKNPLFMPSSAERKLMREKQGRGLAGKIVFITRGSHGIGAGVVRRFADEGATVVFTYSSSEERAQTFAAAVNATAIRADSGSAEDIPRSNNHVLNVPFVN